MLAWFLNLRIKVKVGVSFAAVTLLLMVVVLVIIQQVRSVESSTKQVINLRTPTALASLSMLNGMNHSLASLRAWIILGEEEFRVERAQAWNEQIEPSLAQMKALEPNWTDSKNKELLNSLFKELEDFKKYQEDIEKIAQTEDNTPARKLLFHEAEPLERVLMNNVTQMIKLDLSAPAVKGRRKLVGLLADFEASLGMSMEKLEEYLLSGSDVFKTQFETQWAKNSQVYIQLRSKKEAFSDTQKELLERMSTARDKLGPLLQRMMAIRASEQWNKANYILKTNASPLAHSINQKLNAMVTSQEALLSSDLEEVSKRTHFLILVLVGWFFAGGLLSGMLGSTITQGLTVPIENLNHVTEDLARGNLKQETQETITGDELGILVKNNNRLLEYLKVFRRHAFNLLSGNHNVQEFDVPGDFKKILDGMLTLAKSKDKTD